jgi:hypothetical protein
MGHWTSWAHLSLSPLDQELPLKIVQLMQAMRGTRQDRRIPTARRLRLAITSLARPTPRAAQLRVGSVADFFVLLRAH